jgi:hypothetical protein
MGLFNWFKTKPGKAVVVVDGAALAETQGMKGAASPRFQLQQLRRLSRLSQREKLAVVAVFSGEALNKAPHGKKFDEIEVYYSSSAEAHAQYLLKIAGSKGGGAIVVVGNAETEKKAIAQGLKAMRITTFRKFLESVGEGEREGGDERGERGDRNERGERGERGDRGRNRPPRRRPQQSQDQGQGEGDEQPPREQSERAEPDPISELIDLVE